MACIRLVKPYEHQRLIHVSHRIGRRYFQPHVEFVSKTIAGGEALDFIENVFAYHNGRGVDKALTELLDQEVSLDPSGLTRFAVFFAEPDVTRCHQRGHQYSLSGSPPVF